MRVLALILPLLTGACASIGYEENLTASLDEINDKVVRVWVQWEEKANFSGVGWLNKRSTFGDKARQYRCPRATGSRLQS